MHSLNSFHVVNGMQGFIQDFWLGGGGESIGASTKRGNMRGIYRH